MDAVKVLMQLGVSREVTTADGATPLHLAAMNGPGCVEGSGGRGAPMTSTVGCCIWYDAQSLASSPTAAPTTAQPASACPCRKRGMEPTE